MRGDPLEQRPVGSYDRMLVHLAAPVLAELHDGAHVLGGAHNGGLYRGLPHCGAAAQGRRSPALYLRL